MSGDIKIIWSPSLMEGDFEFSNSINDLTGDAGIGTAIVISLFSDRRASDDDILPDVNNLDKRGWWGDLGFPEFEEDRIGSKLWLLGREKTLDSVLMKAKSYAEEALQWMIDDGVAIKIEVSVERVGVIGTDILALLVEIYREFGGKRTYKYELQWTAQSSY